MDEVDESLMKAIERYKNRNFLVDIAGQLGVKATSPSLTNLSDALIVSAHGSPFGGFKPDKTATNELAKTINERIESGKGGALTMDEIARSMGAATNDVKRVIISACYAAGYNYPAIKKLFPNLEQLVSPSTDKPVSANFDKYLVWDKPGWYQYQNTSLSPYFSITPTSTNVIRQASDWGADKSVTVPLPKEESENIKKFGYKTPLSTNYYGKPSIPSSSVFERIDAVHAWQKEQYEKARREGKRLTEQDMQDILQEAKRRIADAFK